MYRCCNCKEQFVSPITVSVIHNEVDTRRIEMAEGCPRCESTVFDIICEVCRKATVGDEGEICNDCYHVIEKACDDTVCKVMSSLNLDPDFEQICAVREQIKFMV